MTRGWWRTNAVWLVTIVVLVPVTVGAIAVNEWSSFDLGHATKPISVDPGDSAPYDGARIGPASAEFTDAPGAPGGTRVVSATVLVTPGDEPISCVSPVLREARGGGRQWSEASSDLDREYDPALKMSCDPDLPIRYSMTLEYLVPEDATGPFVIELSAADAYPQYVSLLIEP